MTSHLKNPKLNWINSDRNPQESKKQSEITSLER